MKMFLLLSLFLTACIAQAASKSVVVSVGDISEPQNKSWARKTCLEIHAIANQMVDHGLDVTCRTFDTESFLDPDLEKLRRDHDFHIRVTKNSDIEIGLDVTNWSQVHKTDFKQLSWNFHDGSDGKIRKEDAFAKIVGNFFFYVGNQETFKLGLLLNGIHESEDIEFNPKKKTFVDKLTGQTLSAAQAFSRFENESERKANYLRTGIEIGAMFASGMASYYIHFLTNQLDFDYGFKDGLKAKLSGEGIRYDDNAKYVNYGHVYAGYLYYGAARFNGMNSLESFLVGFATSAAWELWEYREVFSINDQIMTPVGGYVIAEAAYQISCALFQKGSAAAKTLGYTLSPVLGVNHFIDHKMGSNKYAAQPDCKEPRWSKISTYIGLDHGQKAYQSSPNLDGIVGIDAQVMNIKNYDSEGSESKFVYDTALAKALIEANTNDGMVDLRVIAQVVAAAYHQKKMSKDEIGQIQGYDVVLGLGSGSTWHDNGSKEGTLHEDFYGTINILGATAHANLRYKGFQINADFSFYGDFAIMKSYALSNFKSARGGDLSDQSSVVQKRGYTMGYGTSALMGISIQKGRVEVGYAGQYSKATASNEKQRVNGTSDDIFRDSIMTNRIYIQFQLTKNLALRIAKDINARTGTVNNQYKASGREKRIIGTLVYKF